MDGPDVTLANLERLFSVGRFDDVIAADLQDFPCELADQIRIFRDENRFGPMRSLHLTGLQRFGRGVETGKVDSKCGSLTGLATRGNVSPALRHDAVNSRKAEARAFRLFLGGEERFEDMGQSFLIHAAPRVLDGKHDVAAAFEIETGGGGFFEIDICGLDLELSAFWHRIQRVDDEIHQDLFDLSFVGFDAPESVAEIEEQIDVFADERLKHDVHVADDGMQIEDLALENLFATKSHQLPRHRRCLLRRIVDQKQLRPHGVVAAQAAEKNFAASDDDGKKIVEVMGDTAGQSS